MRKTVKRLLSVIICILMLFAFATASFAKNNRSNANHDFKDVPKGHWAYDQIMWMLERDIIQGVGNNLFNPGGTVTRAEFAKMMVLTLNIDVYKPDTPSFLDVKKNDWAYPYVESAKPYLTGFRTAQGDYYRPSQAAVREDMAVALVNALGYQNESADESVLDRFADEGQISPNLRRHVALSVEHGLIEGFQKNGQWYFNPKGTLTRAEASMLLYRAFKNNEEKVTYDEDKVTYDDDNVYIKPTVSVTSENDKLIVRWNKIDSPKLTGYAVVISLNDSTPQYPDNGYLYFISDQNQTSAVIDNSTPYSGNSDFGRYLEKGRSYYISVTAVYGDKAVAGNTVRKTYGGADSPDAYTAPDVKLTVENGYHVVRWDKITSNELKAYAVVLSKNDSTPQYPENGYLYYITDKDRNYAIINNNEKYNNGDFGNYLTKGEKYYVSVTAVYNDRNIAGNTLQFEYNGAENPELHVMPIVSSSIENGRLVLRWNKIDSNILLGYRVVASKNDPSPSYPENGFLYWITDPGKNYAVIDNSTAYTDGDFGKYFTVGENYYFSITAVYKDRNITGNTIVCKYEGKNNPEQYQAPNVSADYENGKLVVKWDKIESPLLLEYRLVISKDTEAPAYPANGYYGVYDKNTTSAAVSSDISYTNGDFEKLADGTEYYFSVTAVYTDGKCVAGNAVKKLYLLPPGQ